MRFAFAVALAAALLVGIGLYVFESRSERRVLRLADSGAPGGGQGRVDHVGGTGVYPASAGSAPSGARAQGMASWGQGERGASGYGESGGSELWGLKE